jgi:hypothetical protein
MLSSPSNETKQPKRKRRHFQQVNWKHTKERKREKTVLPSKLFILVVTESHNWTKSEAKYREGKRESKIKDQERRTLTKQG